jgi:septal ring-binding cell division protein DamX/type II secretory pathway predicted ATPase ExeA
MKKNIYFEPPSRLQLLDKLKHFVRFSDFLLLVSGERGAGKSILLSQLQPDASDSTLCFCLVRPEAEISEQQLLAHLMQQFPIHENVGSSYAEQLNLFHLQLKSLESTGQKCLIAIDDAELLSDGALALLLNLHVADAQVLLVSENNFASFLLKMDAVKHMEGRVHHLVIEGMAAEETAEYIELCHPALATLPEKKKLELIQLSSGMPGRIETLLAGGKIAPSTSSRGKRAFPLPALHMAGIATLLIAIVGVSLWQFIPEEEALPVDVVVLEDRVSLPLSVDTDNERESFKGKGAEPGIVPVDVVDGADNIIDKKDDTASDLAKSDLEKRLLEQEEKLSLVRASAEKRSASLETELREVIQSAPVNSSGVVVEQKVIADSVPVVKPNSSEVVVEQPPSVAVSKADLSPKPTINSKPAISSKPTVSSKSSIKEIVQVTKAKNTSEDLLLSWPATGYTLQMSGARSKESALGFIAAQPNSSDFYHFETVYKGLPWHVVVYGRYANRDIANASIRKLPKNLQKVKPWARSIQGVQIDIRKKKSN